MAEQMTFNTLVEDMKTYAERKTEVDYIAQIPRFVMLAENKIASEARGLGIMKAVTGTLAIGSAGSAMAKPARWRETVCFSIGAGAGHKKRVFLRNRTYEYLRGYWADQTQTDEPRFYADYEYESWLIAPSPDVAYPFEIIYHERPQPLDSSHQTNWTTKYAPQLMLHACLLQAQPWLKADNRIATFQSEYDRALKQVSYEQKRRMMDRGARTDESE